MRSRIKLTRQDALTFLSNGISRWPKETLIYLEFVVKCIRVQKWIVSYDNVPEIRALYRGARYVVYNIGYSARFAAQGSEVMFEGDAESRRILIDY
jgi:hypothetical protein